MKWTRQFDVPERTEQIDFVIDPKAKPVSYSREVAQFNEVVLPDGTVRRTAADPFPLFDYIQSFEKETNLSNIWQRYRSGDESVVNVTPGFTLDLSDLPADENLMAEYFSNLGKILRAAAAVRNGSKDQSAAENTKNDKEVASDADEK